MTAASRLLDDVRAQIEASIAAKQALRADTALLAALCRLANRCTRALKEGGKIVFAGNGGSFADAQHLSAEFTSRLRFDRAPLPSLALGTNSSSMSAIGNDYGYDQVFARELAAIATPSDVFIALSTSGNSPNVVAAVEAALRLSIPVVCWTGANGGKLGLIADCLRIPSSDTPRIQECHMLLGHALCGAVECDYFKGGTG